jgi:hypothetical protein
MWFGRQTICLAAVFISDGRRPACFVPAGFINFGMPSSRAGVLKLIARTALAATGVVMGAASCRKTETATAAAPAASSPTANSAPEATKSSAPVPEPVRKVLGRWVRADGGYILELKNAEMSGVLEAAYFNPERPKPINVSRAIWMQGAEGLQVVIELNDVGYPGATYVLTHDAQNDQLVGKYNQPAMQQSFDIEFVRQKLGPMK